MGLLYYCTSAQRAGTWQLAIGTWPIPFGCAKCRVPSTASDDRGTNGISFQELAGSRRGRCCPDTVQRRKSDAELGLNPQQAAGRRLYDQYCDRCHEPYSSRDKKARSLQGVFKKKFLSESGMPANDERVGEIIVTGRNMMPAFGQTLSQSQVKDLLAYLHTL